MKYLMIPLLSLLVIQGASAQNMNNAQLERILREEADDVSREGNTWQAKYRDAFMMMITDEANNRMRLMMPIAEEKEIKKDELKKCMEANFHTALDVKYALSNGYLWSIFVHPLRELTEAQFRDAIHQVYTSVVTYGKTYSSTNLVFPSGEEEE